MRRSLYYRWLFFIVGMMVLALGFTMVIKADRLGISPWDVLHVGLYQNFGLSIGTWAILAGLTLVVVTWVFTKRIPQVGTFLNMLLIGVFIDIFNFLIPDIENLAAQIIMFAAGLIISGCGVGMYVAPKIGAGPRDGLMLVIVEKTGVSVNIAKTGTEVFAAVAGGLLGGPIGVGTVIVALLTGKIVQTTLPIFEKMLNTIIEKKSEAPPILKI
ncbi:YczE/YyaS/YitT family protein [Planococcus salinus]|uniref:YitT family protein n=1 Tax=Planococcus salinus TaxID=1848460 RepID=A0A3M8P8Q1_9BACL|nr:YitT family protein [Planococcus salinus]RNF40086.1 YitT family protein [Planococcus salinus]